MTPWACFITQCRAAAVQMSRECGRLVAKEIALKRMALGTHRVPHVLWLMVSRTGSLLEGRKERYRGGQVTPMRDGSWPGPPAPKLDDVTISGRKSIANHPNTGAEIFLRVFNALKGLLQQFLNLHSQRGRKTDNCHSNSDLMLVL